MTILETLQNKFPEIKHETYYSDLYLYHENLQSIEDFLKSNKVPYTKFSNAIDHMLWIEIPFGYMDEYLNKMCRR